MTLDECVYWLAVLHTVTRSDMSRRAMAATIERDVDYLRYQSLEAIQMARVVYVVSGKRAGLVTWALCRAAIRAIEDERKGAAAA